MPLFKQSILKNQKFDEELIAKRWAKFQNFKSKIESIRNFKEEEYQEGFLKDIFEECLGYTLKTSNPTNYNLEREKTNEIGSKKADGVIVINNQVVGIIELKAIKTTKDLDKSNRELNPIEQAFGYLISHDSNFAKYVIVSNFDEIRIYIKDRLNYEKFNLFNLSYEEFKKFHLLFSFESIKSDLPNQLKEKSQTFEQEISKELYKKFSNLRLQLFINIINKNEIDKNLALSLSQKILDRFIFIFFAEDRGLIDSNTTKNLINVYQNDWHKNPLYNFVKILFNSIDSGNDRPEIFAYNGGLFAKDEISDSLNIDDEILLNILELSEYDFESDIDVNILGHIFENSLDDLEKIRENLFGEQFDINKLKRKKDGIFYTPSYITDYIVKNTLGKICEDKKVALNIDKIDYLSDKDYENIITYKSFLENLKIIDPSCGSGAFLNQAFNYLLIEYSLVYELINSYNIQNKKQNLFDYSNFDLEILENNLFGVDINEEAIEITKLSLWLKTAQKNRKLSDLSKNIKCANSLLNMPFELNSFDVVIGNPPYVRQERIKDIKADLEKNYEVYSGTADLFVYFYELAYKLLKQNGLFGFICSNKFFRAKYGENLRKFLLNNLTFQHIVDFNGVKVFESATVDSAITIFEKSKANEYHEFKLIDSDLKNFNFLKQSDLTNDSFSFANSKELEIKKKIEKIGTPLKEWDIKIYRGILTGFNEAFIIDSKTKDELIKKDSKSAEIIKPILRGRDIKRYDYEFANLWLINTHNNPPININEYPAIKEHLDKFYPQLEKRTDKGATPYNLRNCAYLQEFEKEKIMWNPVNSSEYIFSYIQNEIFFNNSIFMISGKNLKYIISFLNSKLTKWSLSKITDLSQNGVYGYGSKEKFELLPIPKISEEAQQPFIKLVDEILSSKEKIKKYKKHFDSLNAVDKIEIKEEIEKLENRNLEIEKTIDKMVYKLYDLNEDEIRIVEGE